MKNAFELYPKLLRERLIKERKENLWDPLQREKLADCLKNLEDFETKYPDPTQVSTISSLYALHRLYLDILNTENLPFVA
jgi:hypothetical protein